jgi:hypothetical protein
MINGAVLLLIDLMVQGKGKDECPSYPNVRFDTVL